MKKLTALFLAMLMLALPVLGMAASPDELLSAAVDAGRPLQVKVSFVPGTLPVDAEIATIVNDMLSVLSFTYAQQQSEAPQTDFALGLSGENVLTFSQAEKDGVTYLASTLLGSDTAAFNAEESQVILERLLNLAVSAEMLTESDAEMLREQLPALMEQTEIRSDVDFESMDTSGLEKLGAEIAAKATVEEVTMQTRNCDPAVQKITIEVTAEDVVAVYDELFTMLEGNEEFMNALSSAGLTVNGEAATPEEAMAEMKAMIRQAANMMQGPAQFEMYLDEAQEPVGATIVMAMASEEGEEASVIDVELQYNRLTIGEGVTHAATVVAQDDAKDGVVMSLNVLQGEKRSNLTFDAGEIAQGVTGESIISLAAEVNKDHGDTAAKEQAVITVCIVDEDSQEKMGFTVTADTEAAKEGEDVVWLMDGKLYLLDSEEELFTVKAEAATGEAAPSIVSDEAVRPGAMGEEDFLNYAAQVIQAMQTNLVVALQHLPQSVLVLLMGGQM